VKGRAVAVMLALAPSWAATDAQAQTPIEVSVQPSTRALRVDDFLTLEIRATARVQGDIAIQVPAIEGLEEVSRSSFKSSSFSFSNGQQRLTREEVVNVDYVANEPGRTVVPAVVATIAGHSARSRPFEITVRPRPEQPAPSGAPPPPGAVYAPAPDERDVFLRFRTSANEVWVGEQVIVDLVIFADPGASLRADDLAPPPSPDGFWREVIEDNPRLRQLGKTQVAGRTHRAFLRWRVALFPLSAADLELEPVTSIFRTGAAFGRGRRLRRSSRPLTVDVKPLPEAGRPDGFQPGNVGQYELTASVDQASIDAKQGVLLTLRLEGRGNIRNATLPEVQGLEDFRAFPPTRSEKVEVSGGEVRGWKEAEYLLTPRRTGRLEIPSFGVWTFDPAAGAYARRSTDAIPIAVRGEVAPEAATPPAAAPAPAPSSPPRDDDAATWRPVLPEPSLEPAPPPWRRAWFFPALGVPWVAAGLVGLMRSARRRRAPRSTFDARAAKRRVTEALASGAADAAWAAYGDALRNAIADRYGPALANAAPDEIEARLERDGAEPALGAQVRAALEGAGFARYAPDLAPPPPDDAATTWPKTIDEVRR
jgi:hypothetical protein